jgi:hypothetical protein
LLQLPTFIVDQITGRIVYKDHINASEEITGGSKSIDFILPAFLKHIAFYIWCLFRMAIVKLGRNVVTGQKVTVIKKIPFLSY